MTVHFALVTVENQLDIVGTTLQCNLLTSPVLLTTTTTTLFYHNFLTQNHLKQNRKKESPKGIFVVD